MEFTSEELQAIATMRERAQEWRREDLAKREREFYAMHGQKKGRPRGTTSDVSKVSGRNSVEK